jgi:hypothetical protein
MGHASVSITATVSGTTMTAQVSFQPDVRAYLERGTLR